MSSWQCVNCELFNNSARDKCQACFTFTTRLKSNKESAAAVACNSYNMERSLEGIGYSISNKICKTSQGSVWRGIKKDTLKPIIIKIASKELVDSGTGKLSSGISVKLKENIMNEAETLETLNKSIQNSVVQYIDFQSDSHNYFLIMSDGGQCLKDFVEKCHEYIFNEKLDTKQWIYLIQKIFKQIIDLMDILYNKLKICHLDISMENILIKNIELIEDNTGKIKMEINENFEVNLCDFGLAKSFETNDNFQCDQFVGKTRYCSPELFIKKEAFDARANDIWSIGVCLFISLIGWSPYNNPTDIDYQFRLIKNGKIEQLLTMMNKLYLITPEAIDLLQQIFKNEKDRITLQQIQCHAFLRQ